jgi:iron complex outermembrane recepter protein
MWKQITRRVLVAGTCACIAATTAWAQQAADDKEGGLEEIIVTAQNRAQDVNDVPIAIDVIGREELKNSGFADLNNISQIAPAVQVNQDQGSVKITMRGVGTTSNDEAQDTSVVVNIDGEYINRPNILGIALFDMDRVEVLRGPQGTLYGRNSTAGAINFITRRPGHELAFDGSVSYGAYNAIRADAGIDIPFGEAGGFRFAGFYDDRDGYVEHPAFPGGGPNPAGHLAGESDDNHAYGFRATAMFAPTDALSIDFAGEYARREFTPAVFAAVDLHAPGNGPTGPDCNSPGYERVAPLYEETLCIPSATNFLSTIDRADFDEPLFGLGRIGEDTYALRGRIAYRFSDAATLTYVGGYRNFAGDEDNFLTLPIVYRSFTFMDDADTQSHELRLNGQLGGVIYQFGGFYFKEELNRENGFFLPIGPNGTYLSYFGRDVVSESKSLFGQFEVPFGQTNLTGVAGLRYTDNKRDAVYRNAAPFGPGPPDAFLVPPGTPETDYLFNSGSSRKNIDALPYLSTLNLDPPKEDKVTWLAGLNYKPSSDTLVYGKVSTGFKAGGFDSLGAYDPETNTAIELGWKQSFGDTGRNQLNLSAFHYDYRDLQVSVLLDTNVGGQTFNAGKATIWGLEADGTFALSDHGTLHASVNYLNAEYDELFAQFNVFCVEEGCGLSGIGDLDPSTPGVQQPNFAGNRPPFAPEIVISAGYDHVFDLGGAGTLTAGISSVYKSSYFTDFFNYADGEQDGFTQSDVSLQYQPLDKHYSIQVYGHNLEDERALTYGSFVSAGPDDIFNWQFSSPRIFGVRLSVDF